MYKKSNKIFLRNPINMHQILNEHCLFYLHKWILCSSKMFILKVSEKIRLIFFPAECTSFPNDTVSNITDTNKVRCHIPSSCDRVTCCVYVQEVHRHAKLELNMDTCNYQMEGAIDNLRNTYALFDYSWGKWYARDLQPAANRLLYRWVL